MMNSGSNQMKYVAIPPYVSEWCEKYINGDLKISGSDKEVSVGNASDTVEKEMLLALTKIGAHVVRCHQASAFHMLQLDSNSKDLFELNSVSSVEPNDSGVLSLLSDDTMRELKSLVVNGKEFEAEMHFETVSDLVVYLLEQVANGAAHPESEAGKVLRILGLVADTPMSDDV